MSWKRLQSRGWQRVRCGVYARSRVPATPLLLIAAAWLRLPAEAAFSGRTAAWLHGLDLPPCSPIDVTVPAGHKVAHRAAMRFHKARLDPADVVIRQGFRVTSITRTIADIGAVRDLTDAVIALDMALCDGLVNRSELIELTDSMAGRPGVTRLRRAVALADVAESPMETRLRLLLVGAGLPRPVPQMELYDDDGRFIARTDLYFASSRLCVEFDGGHHRDSLVEDNRRQNRLAHSGFSVLRFTASDVLTQPDRVVALVRAALARPPQAGFSRNGLGSPPSEVGFSRNRPSRRRSA